MGRHYCGFTREGIKMAERDARASLIYLVWFKRVIHDGVFFAEVQVLNDG